MRIVETAWLAQPHPDLADAYAHVKLGDSARQRLVRVETLAAKAPGHIEARWRSRAPRSTPRNLRSAREALAPFIAAPTQRVAMLMAEIERTEHGDTGRARAWTLRAVRALHDPAWTADGYVSDRWRPVSPVTGRLDAFQWQTPVAALPSDKGDAIEILAVRGSDAGDAAPRAALIEPPAPVESLNRRSPPGRARTPPGRAGQCAAARSCRRAGPRSRRGARAGTAASPNRRRLPPRPCSAPARTSRRRFRRPFRR